MDGWKDGRRQINHAWVSMQGSELDPLSDTSGPFSLHTILVSWFFTGLVDDKVLLTVPPS
jgi:hypothetical protein